MKTGDNASERFRIFKESMFSLINTPMGLIAGTVLATFYISLIQLKDWSIAIYPIVLTSRGVINGILTGKLSTGLHMGLINPSLRKNTQYFHIILDSQLALSLLIGLLAGSIAFLVANAPLEELNLIIFTCIAAQAIALGLIDPITAIIAFITYKRGLDPDIVLYPFSSSVADVLATASYVISLAIVSWFGFAGAVTVHAIGLIMMFYFCLVTYRFKNEGEYWKTLRESSLSIVITTLIAMVTGYSLLQVRKQLEEASGILVIYPSLIDSLGDIAASFGSIITTRLYLGLIKTEISGIREQFSDLIQIWCSGLIYYVIFGLIAWLIDGNVKSFLTVVISFTVVSPIIISLTYLIAILTFKRGLDPDNFVIPVETSVTDAVLTTCMAALILLFSY